MARAHRPILAAALFCLLLSCGGCAPHFEITDTEKFMYCDDFGNEYPGIHVTVKNTGDAAGRGVSCEARAKDSSGLIIATDDCLFAGGGIIGPSESAREDIIFGELSSHDDYATVEYELNWYAED